MFRLTSWFARNSVAANLLMLMLFLGGVLTSMATLRREAFPTIPPEQISVSVLYPGATPEEVEESICVKIEEAVEGVDGVDRLVSKASENLGSVTIEIIDGYDLREVLDDVKTEIDAIDTFPDDAEEPILKQQKVEERVIALGISGPVDERTLRVLADRIRDELLALPGITKVELEGAREYEFSIEVDEAALRRYQLTFDDLANAVRRSSINLPAGSVKTEAGEILFRSSEQAYSAREFEELPLLSLPDGTQLLLRDVAEVSLGFEDTDEASTFDGERGIVVQVFRVGRQNTPDVAAAVYEYFDQLRPQVPEGIQLALWRDMALNLEERLDLLTRNGLQGLLLVFLVLALFLKARLAFWVGIGLSAAVAGAVWVMPWLDLSINFLSTFGFVLVLGILVDDAIVVAENIDAHKRMGKPALPAAIDGAREVLVPVCLAVFTTGIAFSPMLGLPGRTGVFAATIAMTVIVAIFFSLVESLLILPNHLSHDESKARGGVFRWLGQLTEVPRNAIAKVWGSFQGLFTSSLEWVIQRVYRPVLEWAMEWRYLVLASGLAFLIVTGSLFVGGWIKVSFFPPIEGNDVIATLTMPEGCSLETTRAATEILSEAALQVRQEVEGNQPRSIFRHTRVTLGDQPGIRTSGAPQSEGAIQSRSNLAEVHMELISAEQREVQASEIATRWRELVGNRIPQAVELSFSSDQISTGAPINIELSGDRIEDLVAASNEIKEHLATYRGTFDITDNYRSGKRELQVQVTPSGRALGLTQLDVARQVRQGFYGDEAQRVQLGKDDIRVFVRYPKDDRNTLATLEQMRVRLPGGGEAPFSDVATYELRRGPAAINRIDRQRTVVVTSNLNRSIANANEIVEELESGILVDISKRFPGLRYEFGGEQSRQSESFAGLRVGMQMALVLMFALLAVVFRSYLQPLIVLTAIPFGVAGAIWGHFILGMNLTFLSMIGVLALMGVVVNDSLVMIDFVNRFRRRDGMSLLTAIREAGPRRFRPIILTSLTTVAGLTPILLEKSVQAAFLIPMAISLAFGVGFTTFVILVIVPAAYLVVEDLRRLVVGGEALENSEIEVESSSPAAAAPTT